MANSNEAQARIKINRLLEEAGWRFEDSKAGKANIQLEAGVKYADLGDDFEHQKSGFIDFLLLDKDGRALIAVEAKRESINPLSAKEQARKYAHGKGTRFVILSNGNIHYLWNTKHGNPEAIARFPTQESLSQHTKYEPDSGKFAEIKIDENYVVETQNPKYKNDPSFRNEATRGRFLKKNNLKQLRQYQVQAIKALQKAATDGRQRFLFEMATGTGKTLVAAAAIKLFLESGNARRVLFLVDRLELQDQTQKAFKDSLGKDYISFIYNDDRKSWANADIVVSTIQTFLSGDRYKKEFSPTDFELVISDEAHRSIGGNSRAVFEYFIGYKLGLTATPKNYLHGFDPSGSNTQREYERRILRDTYRTFGCEPGQPTFSYDLEQGANEGHLIKPTVVDARTKITTQLLSNEGYAVYKETEDGAIFGVYGKRDYEHKIFNEETNIAICEALLDNGLYDPVAKELGEDLFGKTIMFAVSQNHAARLTQILNELALKRWPDSYDQSNFAMQVTSQVVTAQQMSANFANNNLEGQVEEPNNYVSSKARVCVTVGMMTTGYDCPDLLNVALVRPIFSPTDFVQIKGRGTRKWAFEYEDRKKDTLIIEKDKFKFFDFFASCEYFEKEFDYDEMIKLPIVVVKDGNGAVDTSLDEPDGTLENTETYRDTIDLATPDRIDKVTETSEGVIMRIDREGFNRAVKEDMRENKVLRALWENGDTQEAEEFTEKHIFNNPKHYLNLNDVRRIFGKDFYITVQELLAIAFGDKETFETKFDRLESEWKKFVSIYKVDQAHYLPVKNFFMAYLRDEKVRDIIKSRKLARLDDLTSFELSDYQKLNKYKEIVPRYVQYHAYHLTNL